MAENSFQNIQSGAIALIDSIEQKVKELDAEIIKLNANVTKLFSGGGANSPNAINERIKALETTVKQLNTALNQQTQNTTQLGQARQNLSQRTSEEVVNQRALAKAADTEAKSQSKLIGAYENLKAKRDQSKKVLQDLIASEKASNAEIKKAQREFDKYNDKVNKANKAVSNFSKTGLGKLTSGFRNLIGAFGIVGGVYMFADMAKSVYSLSKTLESLDYALTTVSDDAYEVARTKEFLSDITNRYGAELVTTTERYIKFMTAAKQSNVSLTETENIFRTVTKAAGVLGLKTHELEGIYLALEQMLSKGKVTTEELRRQLGERLPGAFGIMAESLGVTTQELDKMLKAGEVLSSEALPKFAEQLEKAYGIENIQRVDTLIASQIRLSNSWIEYVDAVREGGGVLGSTLKNVFNLLSSLINVTADLEKAQAKVNKITGESRGVWGFLRDALPYLKIFKSEFNDLVELQEQLDKNFSNLATKSLVSLQYTLGAINKQWAEAGELSDNENKIYAEKVKEIVTLIDKGKLYRANLEEEVKALGYSGEAYEHNGKLIGKFYDDVTQAATYELEFYLEANKKKNESDKDREKVYTKGTIAWYNQQIKKLKELQQEVAKNSDEYRKLQFQINDYLDAIAKIEDKTPISLESAETTKTFRTELEKLIEGLEKTRKLYADNSKEANVLDKNIKNFKNGLTDFNDALEKGDEYILNRIKNTKEWEDKIRDLQNAFDDLMKSEVSGFLSEMGFDGFDMFIDGSFGLMLNALDQIEDAQERNLKKFALYFNTISELAQNTFNFINKNQEAYFDNQLDRLAEEKEWSIQFAGESTAAREEIERQYEEKRKEILRRKAEAEKQTAIFNAVIDTAQAVVSTLATAPWPTNLVMAALVGAIGAAQIAMISSTPIPEYFRGTMNADEGLALVDEKNPEIHTDSKGNIKSLGKDKANYRWLSRGDKIYTSHEEYFNKELKHLLKDNDIEYSSMIDMMPSIVVENKSDNRDIVAKLNSLETTIKEKQELDLTIDKNGFYVGDRKNRTRTERMNNIIRLKRKEV